MAQYGFDGRVVDHVGQSVGTDEQEVVIEKSVGEVFYDQSPIASPADAVEEIFVGVGIAGEAPWGLIDGELPEVYAWLQDGIWKPVTTTWLQAPIR